MIRLLLRMIYTLGLALIGFVLLVFGAWRIYQGDSDGHYGVIEGMILVVMSHTSRLNYLPDLNKMEEAAP